MPKHNPERKFCVLEVFGTSVSRPGPRCQLEAATDSLQERVLKQIGVITLHAVQDVMWKRLMSFHLWEFTDKVLN